MTESEWTRDVCDYLVKRCGCVVKPEFAASRYQQHGWPDRWLCSAVWTGWLEWKGSDTPIQLNQVMRMREIWLREPGGVYVVRKGAGGLNLIQHYEGSNLATWRTPEELLLELEGITYRTREQGRAKIVHDYQLAVAMLKVRIKKG